MGLKVGVKMMRSLLTGNCCRCASDALLASGAQLEDRLGAANEGAMNELTPDSASAI